MKKVKLIAIAVGLVIISVLASAYYLWTPNPISGVYGLARVVIGDENLVKVRANPDLYYVNTKNGYDIDAIIEDLGYTHLKEKRTGSIMHLNKDNKDYVLLVHGNGMFARLEISLSLP